MLVRLLGPVDVLLAGDAQPVRGVRLGAALAMLALHRDRVVSADELILAVWGRSAPATVMNTLQSHLSHLRRLLGGKDAVVAQAPGYRLRLPAESVDVEVAESLIRSAAASSDLRERADRLHRALALWRGDPLADFGDRAWATEHVNRIEQLRQGATRSLLETRIELGDHARTVPDLRRFVDDQPFDEHLHALLMTALYRDGRQAEALATYRRLREVLSDELGIGPGREIRDLESAILRQDPGLDAFAREQVEIADVPTPAQLPRSITGFVGREAELAELDEVLAESASTAGVASISGTAGVGKTTLAVRWAHRVADRFPDGQLYLDLRGWTAGSTPLTPADALRELLEALGVASDRPGSGPAALTGFYRSLLAGRRVLIVLDNARDAAQVRPLLPVTGGSMAVVTSRDPLGGLLAAEGAQSVAVDVLDRADSRALLTARCGSRRVDAEPVAVDEIVERCAGLPLALAVVASRVAADPRRDLAGLAGELVGASALRAFEVGDPAADLTAAFGCSYAALSPAAARLFRLLGSHPGATWTVRLASALAGVPEAEARDLADELTRAGLVTDAHGLHDLVRDYARDLTGHVDSPADREAASRRLVDFYLRTAYAADRLIHPNRPPFPAAVPDVAPEPLETPEEAWAWLLAEHPALLAVQRMAVELGLDDRVWHLAWAMDTFHQRQGRSLPLLASWQIGAEAADRTGDPAVRALAHRRLGSSYARNGDHEQGERHLFAALAEAERLGDPSAAAETHRIIATELDRRGRSEDALVHATAALDLYRRSDRPARIAAVANAVGYYSARCGRYEEARVRLDEALELARKTDDRLVQANTLHSMGYLYRRLGVPGEGLAVLDEALRLCVANGDPYSEASVWLETGDCRAVLGDGEGARFAWAQARRLMRQQRRWSESVQVERRISASLQPR